MATVTVVGRGSTRSQVDPFYVMQMFKAVTARARSRDDVISLCLGQPATPAPLAVRASAGAALSESGLGYTEPRGLRQLREALSEHYWSAYGVTVDADEILVTNGSSAALMLIMLSAFDAGATVAVARPCYPAYRAAVRALGCQLVELPCGPEVGFHPTRRMLEQLSVPIDGLIIGSPSNPTGTIIDRSDLAEIVDWCDGNDVTLVSDEIYHGISFGSPCASAREFSDQPLVLGSMSKYFSMTGWRVGWMLLPSDLYRCAEELQANLAICAPTLSQIASIAAFTPAAAAELDIHVAHYQRNRDLLVSAVDGLGIRLAPVPQGAFYAYCDISRLTDDSMTWCLDVLDRTGVAIAPGIDFDHIEGHRYVRISLCGSEQDLIAAVDRLRAVVA